MISFSNRRLTPIILVLIFLIMLGLSFASYCMTYFVVTGFGGTTQNATNKEIPNIVINQDYKIRFDTNSNGNLDWKFYPEKNTLKLKPGEITMLIFLLRIIQLNYPQVQQHLMFHPLHSVYI